MVTKTYKKRLCLIATLLGSFVFSACGANLHEATLSIALLNTPYTYSLSAEDERWDPWDNSDIVFTQTSGRLPSGVNIGANGVISGIPTELGNFEFRITALAIDDDFWSRDSVTKDSEWYTLFVTEPSTNNACPAPNDEFTSGIFLCAGSLNLENAATGDQFVLDINYFVNKAKADNYDVTHLSFTITYDPSLFEPDPNHLTSLNLREAATRAGSIVSFDANADGILSITIDGLDKTFHKSGRLLDITFNVLQDLEEDEFDFLLDIQDLSSTHHNANWPTPSSVDGLVENTITNSTESESTLNLNSDENSSSITTEL